MRGPFARLGERFSLRLLGASSTVAKDSGLKKGRTPRRSNAPPCFSGAGSWSPGETGPIFFFFIFFDETGASTNLARKNGSCRRGRRLRAAGPHGHYKTITLVAGIRLSGLIATKVFDRPINAALFEDWVEQCLVPALSQGDIVVMDNLSSHKGPKVEQLIKAAGAELRYLPPYSPDMNPIEKAYSKLKAYLRKIAEEPSPA